MGKSKGSSPASVGVYFLIILAAVFFIEASFIGYSQAQATPPNAQSALPSESPAKFTTVTSSFDYVKRDVMIPMRDGIKLHTVILIPKGAKNAPILLTRTPYEANAQT